MIGPTQTAVRSPARPVKAPRSDAAAARQERFDEETAMRAELQREANVLRDMMLTQLKADDDALKKYIAMI